MKVTVEKLPKNQLKLHVEVPPEKMHEFRERACKDLSHEIKIPGFRAGHVPPNVMEQHIGKETLKRQTLEYALPYTYSEAIQHEKIEPVTRPKIHVVSEEPLVYEATVATLPEVKIKDCKDIKISRKEPKVTIEEVEEVLKDLRKSRASYKSIDRKSQKGDRLEIDFEGFDEGGAALEKTRSKNHPLILGEGTLVKDFEDELVGLEQNDKKEFDIRFPKDYSYKPFQDKKVHFKVEVKKLEEVILPEITPELIENVTGMKQSLDDLKTLVGKNILARKQQEEDQRRENELLEELLKMSKVEVPELLLEEEIDYMVEDLKRDLTNKKISYEKFMEQTKKKEENIRKEYEKEAEKRIKLRLILQYLFKEEHLEVSEEELKREIEVSLRVYPEEEQKKIRQEYETNKNLGLRLKNHMLLNKLFKKFLKEE